MDTFFYRGADMSKRIRWLIGICCALGLLAFFVVQGYNFAGKVGVEDSQLTFFVNRSFRFLINDGLAMGLIYALFSERKYVVFALWVQLAGLVGILLPYFALKYYWPHYNGPLISFLHRLVLNPTLLLLLIPAFYYQIGREKSGESP